jgi:transposase
MYYRIKVRYGVLRKARRYAEDSIIAYESSNKDVRLVFLPPYSLEFNVVEGLWKWLKSELIIAFEICQSKKWNPECRVPLNGGRGWKLQIAYDYLFRYFLTL